MPRPAGLCSAGPFRFAAQKFLARFRFSSGRYVEDPWLSRFVGELRAASTEFTQWWQMHNVEDARESLKMICHTEVGQMVFEHTSFLVADNRDLQLLINTPLDGTQTENRVKKLLGVQ